MTVQKQIIIKQYVFIPGYAIEETFEANTYANNRKHLLNMHHMYMLFSNNDV